MSGKEKRISVQAGRTFSNPARSSLMRTNVTSGQSTSIQGLNSTLDPRD